MAGFKGNMLQSDYKSYTASFESNIVSFESNIVSSKSSESVTFLT